jgi:urea transport system substrate-binding protein
MVRRNFMKTLSAVAVTAAFGLSSVNALAAETIKVGVLHSLSGTMAISETALKETVLMAIAEINKPGGVLGKKLEPVVVDPASNWPLFAEKARQLLSKDKVAVTFGCWTSVSRKSVLPVYKELNGLLFYPVQYEGEELEYNVFYTGAAPNQQAIPAVEYLMSKDGGEAKRFVLLGTDYVYPRTTNKILRAFLKSKGVADADIMEEYTPFGHSDYQTIIAKIKKFSSEGKKTAVVSTINGDSNVPFYKELGNAGIKATDVPVVAFSVGEEELRGVDTKPLVGHLASWNYFMSLKNPRTTKFTKLYRTWAVKQAAERRQGGDQRPDGSHLHRRPHVEAGGREGQVDRRRQGDRGDGRADLQGPVGLHLQDGREEPPPAQAGVHRRDQGRWPVRRGLEDPRPDQGGSRGARTFRVTTRRRTSRKASKRVAHPGTARFAACAGSWRKHAHHWITALRLAVERFVPGGN